MAILEYSDFDCSFCAKYATEIFPLIDQAYLQSGQVNYYFRDLPGPAHLNALSKARVARCAGEQDQFWGGAHDRLFRDQSPFDGPGMTAFAKALGLDWDRSMPASPVTDTWRPSSGAPEAPPGWGSMALRPSSSAP